MSILGKLWIRTLDRMDDRAIRQARAREIRKFEDPRRIAIYSGVELSEEQKTAIDQLYLENYGERIPHTWHRHCMAFSGTFDPYYFPELLYIPEFERFMNIELEYPQVLRDKNFLPLIASSVGVKMPRTLFSCTAGLYRDGDARVIRREQALSLLENIGPAFVKPTVETGQGKSCCIIEMRGGVDVRTGKSAGQLLAELGSDFALQEIARCHESLRAIYDGCLNSFRVITYRWRDEIIHMPLILRFGQGGAYLDNFHAGGMLVGVTDEGILLENAFVEFENGFRAHPDTGLVFKGHRIAHVPEMIQAALQMHEAVPQIGCVNWDFTVDDQGEPLLIEANTMGGSPWAIQMAHGRSIFGERTPEVLRWMRAFKAAAKNQRRSFRFGFMGEL